MCTYSISNNFTYFCFYFQINIWCPKTSPRLKFKKQSVVWNEKFTPQFINPFDFCPHPLENETIMAYVKYIKQSDPMKLIEIICKCYISSYFFKSSLVLFSTLALQLKTKIRIVVSMKILDEIIDELAFIGSHAMHFKYTVAE